MTSLLNRNMRHTFADYRADHFDWQVAKDIATITLNRPERNNPLRTAAYA